MVDQVEITNVKGDEVASEETLSELLEVMKKMAKSKGFDPDKVNKKTKDLADNLNDLDNTTDHLIDVIDDNTKALQDNTKAVDGFSKSLLDIPYVVSSLSGAMYNFTGELIAGGTELKDFTQHIPLVGSLFDGLSGFLDDSISKFRELSSVGAAFNNSITDMRITATRLEISLDEMSNMIGSNSETLRILGGSVTEGVKRFSQLNKGLKDTGDFGQLKEMGFTVEEINEGMLSYIDLQAGLGRLERMNNTSLQQGTSAYLKDLDKLAKITGKQREEIAKELAAQATDAGIRALQSQFKEGSKELSNFRTSLALIEEIGGPTADALKDLLDGVPSTQETAKFLGMLGDAGPAVQDALSQIGSGADPTVLLDAFKKSGGKLEEFSNLEGKERKDFIDKLRLVNPEIAAFLDDASRLLKASNRDIDAVLAEQSKRDDITQTLATFEDAVRSVRAEIQKQLLDSGLFQILADGISEVVNVFTDPQNIEAVKNGIRDLADFLDRFIADIRNTSLKEAIESFLFGETAEEQKQKDIDYADDLDQRSKALANQIESLQDKLVGSINSTEVESITDRIKKLKQREADTIQKSQELREKLNQDVYKDNEGLISGFDWPGLFGNIKDYFLNGISDLFTGDFTVNAMVSAIGALWASSKILGTVTMLAGSFKLLKTSVSAINGLLGNTSNFDITDVDKDKDRDKNRSKLSKLGKLGALGTTLFGAFELGNIVTDDTLTQDEKIEQGSGVVGGTAGALALGKAGMSAGAALGSFIPIPGVGTVVGGFAGGLIGGAIGYFGGDMLGTAVGESITDDNEQISDEHINEQLSQLESLRKLSDFNLDQTGIEENLSALRLYAEGMNQIPSIQSAGKSVILKENIISFLGGDNNPFTPLVAFSNLDLGSKTVTNLESVKLFGEAMNNMPEVDVERAGGFFESIRSIFSGEIVMPWDQVREFGDVDIDVAAVTANVAAMKAFGNALSGFSDFEVSELDIPNRFTNNLINISNITGTGLENVAANLERIVGITGVRENLDAINQGLDPTGVRTYATAVDDLVERLNELNKVLAESNDTLLRDNISAAEVLGNINVSTQGSTEGITQLNTLLTQMLTILQQTKAIEDKIEKNTASLSNDTSRGYVSRIR